MATMVQTRPVESANFNHLVMDIAWFAIALAATSRFLQLFAIRMGADEMAISLMTAIPSLTLVFSVAVSSWWRSRYDNSIKAVWWPSIGYRIVFLLPAFAPFFPIEWRVIWLILGASLPALTQGVSSAIFVVMMREAVPSENLARLFSRRQFALNIMLLVGVIAFGFMLEIVPYPYNYQLMFVLAFGFALLSQWHIGQLHLIVPPHQPKRKTDKPAFAVFKERNFQSVAFICLVVYVGFSSIVGVIPSFLTKHLGAAEGYVAIFGGVELIAGAAAMLLLEPMMKRFGSRNTLVLGMLGTALGSFFLALAPSLNFAQFNLNLILALLGSAVTGAAWNIVSVAILRFYTERTNPDDIDASTAFHQVIFGAMFIGPMVGGFLSSFGLPLVPVILLGSALRLLAAILVYFGLSIFGLKRVEPISNQGGD